MTDVTRSPTPLGRNISILAALVAVLLPGLYSWTVLGVGALGAAVLLFGVVTGKQGPVTAGAGLLFLGILIAGLDGAPGIALLLGTVATVVAWDSATIAISLGRQLGRDAQTARVELVHCGTTAVVGCGAVGIAYSVFTIADGGGSFSGIAVLLLGTVLVVAALR